MAWIKQYNGANHFITNEDDGNMFCENSLKWIVSAKNGVPHKFGIDVKHKTHYIFGIKASQLCESKHKHLCIHLICMSCGPMVFQGIEIVGFLYWVDPIDHQSTTQLMFHTLKCKGIYFSRVLYIKVSCVEIFIDCVGFWVECNELDRKGIGFFSIYLLWHSNCNFLFW